MSNAALLPEIADFLFEEAERLDRGDFEGWLDLFAEEGMYWVPVSVDQASPHDHVSLFYEDKLLLGMRIERMRHPNALGMHRPLRSSRVIGNVRLAEAGPDRVVATARFHLLEWQAERLRPFAGSCRMSLVRRDGWRILEKRVDLVNPEEAFESIQIIF